MRSAVRQDNPSLSNTEVSRLLGKMWKEVPNESKAQYKQRAAQAQEEFKRSHPDYTYRKARRKRALNELLTKSAQGFPMGAFGTDPNLMGILQAGGNPYQMMQMYAQSVDGQQVPHPGQMMQMGQLGQMGMPGYPGQTGQYGQTSMHGQMQPGTGNLGLGGFQGMGDPSQMANSMYQYPHK
jgi:transcription factor SOX7/8/10/18 (SOX group E/F)